MLSKQVLCVVTLQDAGKCVVVYVCQFGSYWHFRKSVLSTMFQLLNCSQDTIPECNLDRWHVHGSHKHVPYKPISRIAWSPMLLDGYQLSNKPFMYFYFRIIGIIPQFLCKARLFPFCEYS